ncbi:hypothetical protein JCM9533A_58070 [Catenuloplanes niger JCM 9533]
MPELRELRESWFRQNMRASPWCNPKDVGFASGSPPDMGDQLARRINTSPTAPIGPFAANPVIEPSNKQQERLMRKRALHPQRTGHKTIKSNIPARRNTPL